MNDILTVNTVLALAIMAALFVAASTLAAVALAKKSHTSGGGAVPLEKIDTGDKVLDKQIQKFYNCFLKFSHPDPTGQQVTDCYDNVFGGSNQ